MTTISCFPYEVMSNAFKVLHPFKPKNMIENEKKLENYLKTCLKKNVDVLTQTNYSKFSDGSSGYKSLFSGERFRRSSLSKDVKDPLEFSQTISMLAEEMYSSLLDELSDINFDHDGTKLLSGKNLISSVHSDYDGWYDTEALESAKDYMSSAEVSLPVVISQMERNDLKKIRDFDVTTKFTVVRDYFSSLDYNQRKLVDRVLNPLHVFRQNEENEFNDLFLYSLFEEFSLNPANINSLTYFGDNTKLVDNWCADNGMFNVSVEANTDMNWTEKFVENHSRDIHAFDMILDDQRRSDTSPNVVFLRDNHLVETDASGEFEKQYLLMKQLLISSKKTNVGDSVVMRIPSIYFWTTRSCLAYFSVLFKKVKLFKPALQFSGDTEVYICYKDKLVDGFSGFDTFFGYMEMCLTAMQKKNISEGAVHYAFSKVMDFNMTQKFKSILEYFDDVKSKIVQQLRLNYMLLSSDEFYNEYLLRIFDDNCRHSIEDFVHRLNLRVASLERKNIYKGNDFIYIPEFDRMFEMFLDRSFVRKIVGYDPLTKYDITGTRIIDAVVKLDLFECEYVSSDGIVLSDIIIDQNLLHYEKARQRTLEYKVLSEDYGLKDVKLTNIEFDKRLLNNLDVWSRQIVCDNVVKNGSVLNVNDDPISYMVFLKSFMYEFKRYYEAFMWNIRKFDQGFVDWHDIKLMDFHKIEDPLNMGNLRRIYILAFTHLKELFFSEVRLKSFIERNIKGKENVLIGNLMAPSDGITFGCHENASYYIDEFNGSVQFTYMYDKLDIEYICRRLEVGVLIIEWSEILPHEGIKLNDYYRNSNLIIIFDYGISQKRFNDIVKFAAKYNIQGVNHPEIIYLKQNYGLHKPFKVF